MKQILPSSKIELLLRILLPIFFFSIPSLQAQHLKAIAQSIQKAQLEKRPFQNYNVFQNIQFNQSLVSDQQLRMNDLVFVELDHSSINNLMNENAERIEISFPLPSSEMVELLLEKQILFDDQARTTTPDDLIGRPIKAGAYYRGIIKNDPESFVAISFFSNEIMGVISNSSFGNINIGKEQNNNLQTEQIKRHVIFKESSIPQKNPFQCGVSDHQIHDIQKHIEETTSETVYPSKCKAVKIFLECSYRLFTDRGSSVAAVEAYMTGLFNVVKALYANEQVVIEISEFLVWNKQDPYLTTTLQNIIYDYANRRKNNFNGTLAQLVTTFPVQQQGGIAFVDGMCKTWDGNIAPLSFAYIYNQFSTLPTYSWSVEVMTHEMGHNFGSWHTHSCVWGPNKDSQIDNCQPADIGTCNNGVTPTGGGTIMSYCHLTSVGINFSKGFGPEPGAILRNSFNTKTCIPSSFAPISSHSIAGPYFQGDSFRLVAKPYNKNYTYDWLHYDYIMNKKSDTAITIRNSGIYTLAISSTNCTEYAKPDTINFYDILVNLGCPLVKGQQDSFYREVSLQVDNAVYSVDSLDFPVGLYSQIPTNAIDPHIELQMTITPKGASFTRSVVSQYQSPDNIGISNASYTPNDLVAFGLKSPITFTRILGNFDPAGIWKFSAIDIRLDAGIDAIVVYKIVIKWRFKDSVSICDIPLCDNHSKILDAGIPNAIYTWTNGEKTKSISTNKPGNIGVTLLKNGQTTSHSVNLILTNTQFSQEKSICEGSSLQIGKNIYTKAGTYIDTFTSINSCDSILTTILNIRPKVRTFDTLFKCYGESFNNITLRKDTSMVFTSIGQNNCDSIHTLSFLVNPQIFSTFDYEIKCNNVGTDLLLNASGGTGPLKYLWNTNDTSSTLSKITSGTYSVSISDQKNCQSAFNYTVSNYDSVSIKEQIMDVQCFGDANGEIKINVITGTPPFTYNWNIGKQGPDINNLAAGKYLLIILDANACRFENTFEVKAPDLLIVSGDAQASNGSNGSIKLSISGGTAPFIINWSNGETTMDISNLIPGTYTVTVLDQNGCKNVQSYEVRNSVSTSNSSKSNLVSIYPNPANNLIYLHSNNQSIKELILFDVLGKSLLHISSINEKETNLDLKDIEAGYYIIRVGLVDGSFQDKMLVKM